MAAIYTVSTPAGRLHIYDKSIKADFLSPALFFGTQTRIEDLPATFVLVFQEMIRAAYKRGKEAKAREISAKLKELTDAMSSV